MIHFQLKERLLLSHLLDDRKHAVVGCSHGDEPGLKRSLDQLVDMLLGEEPPLPGHGYS